MPATAFAFGAAPSQRGEGAARASDAAEATGVVIVGAGFAGICLAIRLKQTGVDDFLVLDEGRDVGGTWRDNVYPGAACDIESHLYSFSFEPNPDWTRQFAAQPEILEYARRCVDKYGLRPHLRLGRTVVRAASDPDGAGWTVETRDGEVFRARVVVSACGGLSRPATPDIRGLGSFAGKIFHTARWDTATSLAGKRVAVIGTGASAIQIVPTIAPEVARLHVLQRTPPWILPKPDRPIPARERDALRASAVRRWMTRIRLYWQREILAVAFVAAPWILKYLAQTQARLFLRKSVKDPELRAKLLPRYTMGCKRILPTNDWYPAIQRENVELVTDPIREITARGLRLESGREIELDLIVLATGFDAADNVAPFEIRGKDGRSLGAVWRDGAEAYLGTAVAGFPNLFILIGPNTGLGHNSMLLMIESQAQYVSDAVRTMRARGLRAVEIRREAQARYNRELQARLARTVWASGCTSWYLSRTGRNTTLWPGFTFEFRLRTRRFDANEYRTTIDAGAGRSIRVE